MEGMREAASTKLDALLIGVLFIGVVLGQLLRIQPVSGTSGAVLPVDLALIVVDVVLFARVLAAQKLKAFLGGVWRHPVWKWSLLFAGWAAVSLLLNLSHYTGKQDFVAFSYLGRLWAAFVFCWLAWFCWRDQAAVVRRTFLFAAAALLLSGFVQLIFLGNFAFMTRYGWDPHLGRMLSTFFDPNYFGVFLALVLVSVFAGLLRARGNLRRWWLAAVLVSWAGLFLTYSRSAWLAAAIALTGLSLKHSLKTALVVFLVFAAVLLIPNRLSQRFSDSRGITHGTSNDAGAVTCDAQAGKTCDVSGSLRVVSIKRGLKLAEHHWVAGVGYNAYGYALVRQGIAPASRLSSHSAQGSDSSLVNIWATTGVVGLVFFLVFLLQALRELFPAGAARNWQAYSLFWFTLAWIAVSFFNNALLYPSILTVWLALLAINVRPAFKTLRHE
jgi:hypothetical protein